MANNSSGKSTSRKARKRAAKVRPGAKMVVAKTAFSGLTTAERNYARLLSDPCNGPLSAGIFGDGSGGIISRFETDGILGDVAGTAASALVFVPSAASAWTSGKPSDGDLPTWNGVNSSLVPGKDFLSSNASQFRCLAACIRIYWPGTELNRQGIVSNLQTTADIVNNANATVGAIRATSTYVQRMPEDFTELKWMPSEFELELRAPFLTPSAQEFSRVSGLVTTISGVPAATPIRWRMVAVYEWVPKVQSGIASSNIAATVPAGSFERVAQALTSVGNWMYASSYQAAQATSALVAGAQATANFVNGASRIAFGVGRAMAIAG